MDVQQQIAKEENGDLSFDDFNRLSRRAELRLLWWITGDIRGGILPEPYVTQKNRDMVSPFTLKYDASLDSLAQITRPADYYQYENMFSLGVPEGSDECDEDDKDCGEDGDSEEVFKTPIKLLDNQQFYKRANSYIESLRPSLKKPIAKQIGKKFEFLPVNLPGVTLEYIRYPIYGKIITKLDTVFNQDVVDEAVSINYEWTEGVIDLLVWIIVDFFGTSVREAALKQANEMTNKGVNK